MQVRGAAPKRVAIPSRYNDILFRSRTEARWAIYFDALGVRYEYEREGYKLKDGWFLPDFWLPAQRIWCEVKPEELSYASRELRLAQQLAGMTGHDVVMLWGSPRIWGNYSQDPDDVPARLVRAECDDEPYVPCLCRECGKFGIEFDGRADRICRHDKNSDKGYNWADPRLREAVKVAQTFRFWDPVE